ncbi:Uncharacterized protein APZ42_011892 [Daphnia magna]|uniref:Uncharacterized protein n=1 Tax=Daphnia magna TaxID=35525 RepID=A0A162SEJ4_9CRUS|nr:Uncharacterized protein APZ42_011892 [Daphnia magna]
MSPAVQNQINFPCRKLSVRRKMDFDHDLASPTKSPRKGKSFKTTWSNYSAFVIVFEFFKKRNKGCS